MPRRRPPPDDSPQDRWVVSYADFITLLLAFFVVMYAISTVNEEKYRALSEALSGVFESGGRVAGNGGQPLEDDLAVGDRREPEAPPIEIDAPDEARSEQLRALLDGLRRRFSPRIDDGEMKIDGNDLWITIELRAAQLFPSGSALPQIEADALLGDIAELLVGLDNPIHVEGFTDDRPIETDQFPSNWELSAARAAAVVRILALNGLAPQRMAAVGYGEYQPAYSNRTAEGRSRNRRVVVVISRDERVRRAVQAFGSQQISTDAVSELLQPEPASPPPALEQVETQSGGILYRQAEPEAR
ncbi:flagellar motor protein MotD [Marinobacterium nitratireducens]|uniref:Flagellar motor protein MotD n=1 Tax=Marinobacterium nitratireducens TaxID=518897 RepID=A0A918DVE0_9GAMM|nr:flagellar motor protein MotD [Marinobacterium nitratireducens]GGO85046.1 flagellar motor protein MotD [Marinobacterium nitratireducens]